MAGLHISISAEPIFNLGPLVITNSFLVSLLVTGFLSLVALSVYPSIKPTDKPKGAQNFLEMIIDSLLNLVTSIVGTTSKAKEFFPYVATFFLFILLGNWAGLLPGVGSIGFYEIIEHEKKFVPLFRGATADLNSTLALGLTSIFLVQYVGLKHQGFKYLSKFINFHDPISFFIGILELIAELARIMSFAFRLFGNIFAGEVLLGVISFLVPIIAPLPFLGLEIFVGLVQALVFSMLTMVFMNLATISHEEH